MARVMLSWPLLRSRCEASFNSPSCCTFPCSSHTSLRFVCDECALPPPGLGRSLDGVTERYGEALCAPSELVLELRLCGSEILRTCGGVTAAAADLRKIRYLCSDMQAMAAGRMHVGKFVLLCFHVRTGITQDDVWWLRMHESAHIHVHVHAYRPWLWSHDARIVQQISCELLLGVHLVLKNALGDQAILGALGAAANTSHQAALAITNSNSLWAYTWFCNNIPGYVGSDETVVE